MCITEAQSRKPAMTVKELIKKLSKLDPDLSVFYIHSQYGPQEPEIRVVTIKEFGSLAEVEAETRAGRTYWVAIM
jgi:hypothetical protein